MELTFACPDCGVVSRIREIESASTIKCSACGHARQVRHESIKAVGLAACALCGTDDLYIQKDFPHILGLSIVVVGFVVSSVFWAYYMPISTLAVLLLTAALDLVLYYLVPDVTICYRCLSQYRGKGADTSSRFAPFDLAIGERYRQERIRVEKLRQQKQPVDPVSPS